MVHLQLTNHEVEELLALLDGAISDLSPEIAHTDNAQYRTMLRDRRDCLSGIRDRVAQLPKSQLAPSS